MSSIAKRIILILFASFLILVGTNIKNIDLVQEDDFIEESPEVSQTTPTLFTTPASLRSLDFHHRASRNSSVKVQKLAALPTQEETIVAGHGSGTYFKFNGSFFILTAAHVVDEQSIMLVTSEDTFATTGQVVYVSQIYDLAILSVPRIRGLRPANISALDTEDWIVGNEVVYTGFPSSYNLLTSTGFVSGMSRSYNNSILIQGFAWPGSSGAGVFNENGNLIGLIWALGVEHFRGRAQALETLVYVCPITENEWEKIRETLRKL